VLLLKSSSAVKRREIKILIKKSKDLPDILYERFYMKMKHIKNLFNNFTKLTLVGLAATTAFLGCSGGGSTVSVGSSDSSSTAAGTAALTSFKQVLGAGFAVVGYSSQNNVMTASNGDTVVTTSSTDMEIKGSCTRGIDYVVVKARKTAGSGSPTASMSLSTNTPCTSSTFSWIPTTAIETSFGVGAEGTWEFKIHPVDGFGNELTAQIMTLNVTIRTIAPAIASAPTIQGNACPGVAWSSCSAAYISSINNPPISFTVPITTFAVQVSGGSGSLDNNVFTDGTAVFTPSLAEGSTTAFTIQTYDSVGNTSGSLVVNVTYTPPLAAINGQTFGFNSLIFPAAATNASLTVVNASFDGITTDFSAATGDTSQSGSFGIASYLIGFK
jgi:hypothetical protein